MQDKTFIYLWRSLMETSFYKNPLTCHLAVHLLLDAAWKDHEMFLGGKKVTIKRGQIPCGRNTLAEATGLSPQNIRTSLKHLQQCGFLTIESTNVCSIITICKYNEYQSMQPLHQPTSQPTINQPSTNHQPLQNKGYKGNKENNMSDNALPDAEEIFEFYIKHIRLNEKSGMKIPTINNLSQWLKEYEKGELIEAIKNYSSACNGRQPKYNKKPANFFGRSGESKGFFKDFLPAVFSKQCQPDLITPKPFERRYGDV